MKNASLYSVLCLGFALACLFTSRVGATEANDTLIYLDLGPLTEGGKEGPKAPGRKLLPGAKGIPVVSVGFSANIAGSDTPVGVNRELKGPGATKISPIVVEIEENSELYAKLYEAILQHKPAIETVHIQYYQTGPGAIAGTQKAPSVYFSLTLKSVLISGFEMTSDSTGPHARVSLTPELIQFNDNK